MTRIPAFLLESDLRRLFEVTAAAGGEARVVGGAVRDTLLGLPVGDVDIASTLLPEHTMTLAAEEGWKVIPTGLAHGTVTLVLTHRTVEVTTLRHDVETDGRHAIVAFTTSFEKDAARRDFTINALYMDAHGAVYDYFKGQQHLVGRQIVFIGNAVSRIEEDGLRILRFFRFLATHGKPLASLDALSAIRQLKDRVDTLSGERIAAEMKKMLQAEAPYYAIERFVACGLAPLVSHVDWQLDKLQQLLQMEEEYGIRGSSWVRLMTLLPRKERSIATHWICDRWKVSRQARTVLMQLSAPMMEISTSQVKEWLRTLSLSVAQDLVLLAAADGVSDQPLSEFLTLVEHWHIPKFPVVAADLLQRGYEQGPALGMVLRVLEAAWVASDYRMDKEALLDTFAAH